MTAATIILLSTRNAISWCILGLSFGAVAPKATVYFWEEAR
jgi:hypothetical protein